MSTRGRMPAPADLPLASSVGEITVQEFGYGLGPPSGILVLRYPPGRFVPDFPENREDFLHQIFWSPDGVMLVRRGDSSHFIPSGQMLWIRTGVVAEVRGLRSQTVLRVCVRAAPPALTALAAATVTPSEEVQTRLLGLAKPGVDEVEALRARVEILEDLAGSPAMALDHLAVDDTPARVVARALLGNPADATRLTGWAERLHVSAKTLQRDIDRVYGTSFTTLRTRIRLRAAVAYLKGGSVTETAHLVGYASASAFVSAFTREFGRTPGAYLGTSDGASDGATDGATDGTENGATESAVPAYAPHAPAPSTPDLSGHPIDPVRRRRLSPAQ